MYLRLNVEPEIQVLKLMLFTIFFQVGLSHAKQLVKLMANNDLGACAYANLEDVIKSQWKFEMWKNRVIPVKKQNFGFK